MRALKSVPSEHSFKLEKVPFSPNRKASSPSFKLFCRTLAQMQVGESFYMQKIPSHYRVALGAVKHALDREYVSRSEGTGVRIGRVS